MRRVPLFWSNALARGNERLARPQETAEKDEERRSHGHVASQQGEASHRQDLVGKERPCPRRRPWATPRAKQAPGVMQPSADHGHEVLQPLQRAPHE